MAGGERRETEDAHWDDFIRGIRNVREDATITQEVQGFAHGAPQWPPPIAPRVAPLTPDPEEPLERLDEIGVLLRTLTYGEMIALADELWKARGEGEIDLQTLPAVFHCWATKRRS